jgi:hypothetical protein
MSLVQVWLEDERARVAVDTCVYRTAPGVGEEVGVGSKLIALPHAGLVLAFRGADLAFFQVFAQLYLTAGNDSFDETVGVLPVRVQHAASQFPRGLSPMASSCELHVVGYSRKEQRFASVLFEVDLRAGKAEATPLTGPCRVAPGFNSVPALSTDEGMMELARAQLAWMRDNEPKRATGGRLLVADVTHASVSIRDVGEI